MGILTPKEGSTINKNLNYGNKYTTIVLHQMKEEDANLNPTRSLIFFFKNGIKMLNTASKIGPWL